MNINQALYNLNNQLQWTFNLLSHLIYHRELQLTLIMLLNQYVTAIDDFLFFYLQINRLTSG
jgi:hypothetical protein